jgi:small nuclear ribonucleoprotein (snRNP)-like protein
MASMNLALEDVRERERERENIEEWHDEKTRSTNLSHSFDLQLNLHHQHHTNTHTQIHTHTFAPVSRLNNAEFRQLFLCAGDEEERLNEPTLDEKVLVLEEIQLSQPLHNGRTRKR